MTKPEIPQHEGTPNDEARMTSTMPELACRVIQRMSRSGFGLRHSFVLGYFGLRHS